MWHDLLSVLLILLAGANSETQLRTALQIKTGVVELPAGETEISREIVLAPDVHDLEIRGSGQGTVLKAGNAFRGRAILVLSGGKNIRIHDLQLDGNRDVLSRPIGMPSSETPFSRFTPNNGIMTEGVTDLEISNVKAKRIAGFALLVNAGHKVRVHDVEITDSGSLNSQKRNNTTGGILLEEGTANFEVTHCRIGNVRGNGIWTHSLYRSPRNTRGRIAENEFALLARDAIQVGHATEIEVENNRGHHIGFPLEEVDLEGHAFPVAIDTAGNVDRSFYRNNVFEEIDGKCIDLDGFHDGEVSGNSCTNTQSAANYPYGNQGIVINNSNPDMQSRNIRLVNNTLDGVVFSGIFVIGSGHTIKGNHLMRLNLAHCNEPGPFNCLYAKDQPDLLRTGIYLAAGADRPDPAKGNTIEGNEISGYGMSRNCIRAAPGVSLDANHLAKNECSDEAAVARAQSGKRH